MQDILKNCSAQAIRFFRRNATGILMGFGIAGTGTAVILAVRATPQAMERIEARKHEEHRRKLTTAQTVQAVWKCYIPAAATWTLSAGCLIGAHTLGEKRNAALATAYSLVESTLRSYRTKLVDEVGEEKEAVIREAVDRDILAREPKKLPKPEQKQPESLPTPPMDIRGVELCYDRTFGCYFYSNRNLIEKAANTLNRQMATMAEPYVSLNDFYQELGAETTDIGELLGWNLSTGLIEPEFSSQITNGGQLCLVMSHKTPPMYHYFR